MSDTCGNCSCADKSQCVKKSNQYGTIIVDTETTYGESFTMGAENDCKCNSSKGCSCNAGCSCGCH